ncbi:MAG: beta-glucosidase [Rubrobacter sp.]|nr:beta-glucosidase [Rubrobacter sp.]
MSFPDGFLWGAAAAAYQIEGAVDEDGRGTSVWDTFSHTPGKVLHGDTGDIACDHYHRLEEDLDLMSELGLRAYRFSIAWPRIQPEGRGEPNQKGLDFYKRLVEGLRQRSIVPAVTLYHWDLPQALEDRGGWTRRETAERFAEYAGLVYEALSDTVPVWITLNEPWVSAWLGYGAGVHAPGHTDTGKALSATHHLLLGHGLALGRLRSAGGNPENRVGITLNLSPVRPGKESKGDAEAARKVDGNANRLYLDPLFRGEYPQDMFDYYPRLADPALVREGDLQAISRPLDFLGVNYYMRHTVREDTGSGRASGMLFPGLRAKTVQPHGAETTAMGWAIEPDGLTELLLRLHREYTGLPIYITENGAAFHDYANPEGTVTDEERIAFLDAHFRAAEEAVREGVDLRGYFVWSLLDNFEWAEGYSRRFGLVYVDYATQRRIPKESAHWYREVIRRNGPPQSAGEES